MHAAGRWMRPEHPRRQQQAQRHRLACECFASLASIPACGLWATWQPSIPGRYMQRSRTRFRRSRSRYPFAGEARDWLRA
jgi:hypothetical protein